MPTERGENQGGMTCAVDLCFMSAAPLLYRGCFTRPAPLLAVRSPLHMCQVAPCGVNLSGFGTHRLTTRGGARNCQHQFYLLLLIGLGLALVVGVKHKWRETARTCRLLARMRLGPPRLCSPACNG